MPPRFFQLRFFSPLCIAAVFATAPRAAPAAAYIWNGAGSDSNWSTGANWSTGNPPPSSQNTSVTFSLSARLAPQENIAADFLLNSLSFTSTGTAFVLGGSGALDFRTNSASTSPTITRNAAGVDTINNNLILTSGVTLNTVAGAVITLGGSISGGALTAAGQGVVMLTGTNSFTGAANMTGGTLDVGSAGALGGGGTLSFTGGTLQYSAANATDYSGRFSTAANQAYSIDTNGQNVTLGTALTSSYGTLTKLGAGTLTLSAVSTYTGTTTVSAGTLAVGSGGGFGGGNITVGPAATLALSGTAAVNQTSYATLVVDGVGAVPSTVTLADNATLSTGSFTVGNNAAGTFVQTGGTVTSNGILVLGESTASVGSYSLSGTNSVLSVYDIDIGYQGAGTFTQTGGTVGPLGSGPGVILAYYSGSGGTYSLSAGTLSTATITVGYQGAGTFTQTGGTVNTHTGYVFLAGYTGGSGSYSLSGTGSLNAGSISVGAYGTGTFTQSGGSVSTNNGSFILGENGAGNGTYALSGTGSLSTGRAVIGAAGVGAFTQEGGTFTTNGQALFLSQSTPGAGTDTYLLSGGTLTTGSTLVGDGGTATFTQTGGLHTTNSLTLSGSQSASVGTYNLQGGVFNTGRVLTGDEGVTGKSIFNFNGGTLQASVSDNPASRTYAYTFFSGVSTVNVQSGGATGTAVGGAVIDTNGFNVTVASSLQHDTTSGTPAIDGGLTKVGAGILTLTVANTYTGGTTVNQGTLAISASGGLGTGSVSIAAGATLSLDAGVKAAHNASTGTTLSLASTTTSIINLAGAGVQDTVGTLVIDGMTEPAGTYGAAGSGAAHTNCADFTGTGELLVVPEPATWAILLGGASLLGGTRRRRCGRAR